MADKESLDFPEGTILYLSHDEYAKLLAAINNPPKPTQKLRELMQRKAPWDK